MTVRIGNATFNCAGPKPLVRCWAAVLSGTVQRSDETYAACVHPGGAGLRLLFNVVPEPKTVKNRVHLDLRVSDKEAKVERLARPGARKVKTFDEVREIWTVMAGPEGNWFRVRAAKKRRSEEKCRSSAIYAI